MMNHSVFVDNGIFSICPLTVDILCTDIAIVSVNRIDYEQLRGLFLVYD